MTGHNRPTDVELVAGANAGDAQAFDALYDRHRTWAYRVAFRFTGEASDALDVVQETFLYVLQQFPGLELRSRFTTYLYPIIRSVAMDGHRRLAREQLAREAATEHHRAHEEDEAHTARSDELEHLLDALSAGQREVLLMRVIDSMTMSEIATALSIPEGTAKSRLHGALTRLRADPRTSDLFA
ncbi:MAG: RNA polymerase sigma factor [Planctomycetota bacterium]